MKRYELVVDGQTMQAELGGVGLSCETVEKVEGYPLDCDDDTVQDIAPGGSKTLSWSGRLYDKTSMPVECSADPTNPFVNYCWLGTAAQPGPIAVVVQLFATATCHDN